MESLVQLLVILLFIVIFHLGKYPEKLVPSVNLGREYAEAIILFGAVLFIYWSKTFYPSLFTWGVYGTYYLVIGLCLLFIMEKIVRRRGISSVGFKLPINRKALMIFTGAIALYLIVGILRHVLYGIEFLYINEYFISGVILGPFYEETVFRGLIQTRFEAGSGTVKSWIFSGLLFGFYHYWAHFLIVGQTLTIPSLTQLIWVTLFGMLLGVIFAKTRSLLPPFLLHAINNFFAYMPW